jgi:hypothetical protein
MHLTYIIALSINHINNIITIMHKENTTQDIRGSPQCGAMSTNSSLIYFLLLIFYKHRATRTHSA